MDKTVINQLPVEKLRGKRVFVRIDVDAQDAPAGSSLDDRKLRAIAMGSHGLTGVLRLLMGSTSRKVLDRAKCPVLIARIPDEEMVRAGMLEG